MVKFRSRREAIIFYVALTVSVLLIVNGVGNGFFSLYSDLTNREGRVPVSDAFEKGVINTQELYFTGIDNHVQVLPSNYFTLGSNWGIRNCNSQEEISVSGNTFPCYDIDNKPYFLAIMGGSSGINPLGNAFHFVQDLRGKNVQFSYWVKTASPSEGGVPAVISSNCGSYTIPSPGSERGIARIDSSLIDDNKYAFSVNGNAICGGYLNPGEKLRLQIGSSGSSTMVIHHIQWTYPYICSPGPGYDLAFEDFSSGKTVTLTGSTQRWPKALCPELSPILINQSAHGINRLTELLKTLATPPKDQPPYVVPSSCNADNSGGCVLRLPYWIVKDPTVPTACVDPTMQKAFNLNTKQCDDIINIRNFCTDGIIFNNECLTPTEAKAKFNCTGTLDLNGPVPVCYDSRTRTGVLAFCKPSDGGYDPLTGKCADHVTKQLYEPYTTFESACKADGGSPSGDQCLHEVQITFQDNKGITTGTASLPPVGGITNVQGYVQTAAGPKMVTQVCEIPKSDGTCNVSVSENDLNPWYERYLGLDRVFFGFRLKFWLLIVSVVIVFWIGIWPRGVLFRR